MNAQQKLIEKLQEVKEFVEINYSNIYESEMVMDTLEGIIADMEDNMVDGDNNQNEVFILDNRVIVYSSYI
jgi:hypothetical protein